MSIFISDGVGIPYPVKKDNRGVSAYIEGDRASYVEAMAKASEVSQQGFAMPFWNLK